MMRSNPGHGDEQTPFLEPARDKVPFGSNAIRLRYRSWTIAALILLALYAGLPRIWKQIEPLHNGPDYRIPYALSEDYWLYSRYAQAATVDPNTIPIIGDSVIWGQYVATHGTFSHALNEQSGRQRFVNLGVNGTHPVALAGLINYYGGGVNHRKVILHFNPLWMSSKRRDLTIDKTVSFNHPQLVPQFYPRIRCYDASVADRLSLAIAREIPFLGWTAHLRRAYFQNESLPSWTLKQPYTNPASMITLKLPQPEDKPPSDPVPWLEKDARLQSFAWVAPDDSLQWAFFKRSIEELKRRGNEVFVLVGPFNEHLLTEDSRAAFLSLRDNIAAWLNANGVENYVPAPLPSETYADASHPLESGYAILARELVEYAPFRKFMER